MTPPPLDLPTVENSSEASPEAADHPLHSFGATPLPTSQRSGMRWLRRMGWGLVFVGTAIASSVGGALLATTVPLPSWVARDTAEPLNVVDLWQSGFRYRVTRPVNIVVMGIDEVPGSEPGSLEAFEGRTDTLLLLRLDPDAKTVNLLSIPRDTRVDIPGAGVAKINDANVVGGPELVAETIQANLGPVPVDRYVRVNTEAFREIVDLVGGVEVMVPQRMKYRDLTQDLNIDLEQGWQTLNGDQAEQFARFRADGQGDIGRVQRQQMLLKALRERLTSPTVIPRLPQIIRVALRYVDTNLTLEEILALASFSLDLEAANFQMVMLPGRFSTPDEFIASYWILEPGASQQVMTEFFNLDTVALLSHSEPTTVTGMRIAIQNASSQRGASQAVAQALRQQGFYNVYVISDWPTTLQRTQVIAQRGDLDSAQVVSSVLGVGRVVAESTGDLQSDLTLRIGEDWIAPGTTMQ